RPTAGLYTLSPHDALPICSHSGAYLKGEYLITAGVPLPDWLDTVRRAFLRILPWHEDDDSGAIGIPYIDYKRGDGVSVGPGQDKDRKSTRLNSSHVKISYA